MNIIRSIQNRIYEVRGERVMLDFDLADLYEVPAKALNQAVKRNIKRFPKDFMFRLTLAEWQNIRSQIVTGYGTSNSLRSQNVTASQSRRNTNVTPVYGMKTVNKANCRDERLLLQQAINLLHTLRKEYHIIEEKI